MNDTRSTPRSEQLLKYIADAFVATPDLASQDRFEAMREIRARLSDPSDLLRQLVLDCQNDLATYIVPDSGISEHDVVNTLLGRLDGPQARAALSASSENARHAHRCMSCGEAWYCLHPPTACKAGENVLPSLTLRGPNGPTVFHHACQGKK